MDLVRGRITPKIIRHFDEFFCKSLKNKKIRQIDAQFPVKIHPWLNP